MKMDSKKNINPEHYVYSTKYKKYVKESSLKAMEEKGKSSAKATKAKNQILARQNHLPLNLLQNSSEKQSLGKCPVCGSDVYEYEKDLSVRTTKNVDTECGMKINVLKSLKRSLIKLW